MSLVKKMIMSNLPVNQEPTRVEALFDGVFFTLKDFKVSLDYDFFLQALKELETEQALVVFKQRPEVSVVATRHGFVKYGTE